MTQTKHTPQIDEYNPVDGQFFIVKDKQGKMIGKAFELDKARLIAAAPELLEALEIVKRNFLCGDSEKWKTINAAIDKAKGV